MKLRSDNPVCRKMISLIKSLLVGIVLAFIITACASTPKEIIKLQNVRAVEYAKIAESKIVEGNYEEALENYKKSERLTRNIADKNTISYRLNQIAYDDLLSAGKLPEAEHFYLTSIDISEFTSDSRAKIVAYSGLGFIYHALGRHQMAIDYFSKAIDIQKSNDGYRADLVKNLNSRAKLLLSIGKFSDAKNDLVLARKTADAQTDIRIVIDNNIAQGILYLYMRNNTKAHSYLEKAIALTNSNTSVYGDLKAKCLYWVGWVYRQQYDPEKALINYKESLAKYEELLRNVKDSEVNRITNEKINVLQAIGEAYKEQNNYKQAQHYINMVQNESKNIINKTRDAINLIYLGEISYKMKYYQASEEYFNEAIEAYKQIDFRHGQAKANLLAGFVQYEVDNQKLAKLYIDKAKKIYSEMNDKDGLRRVHYLSGLYHYRLGKEEAAILDFIIATENFESVRSCVYGDSANQVLFNARGKDIYEKLISIYLEQGNRKKAYEYLQKSKIEELRKYFLDEDHKEYQQLEEIKKNMCAEENYLKIKGNVNQKVLIRWKINKEKYEELVGKILASYERQYELFVVNPDRAPDYYIGQLPADYGILEYFVVANENIKIFLVTNEDIYVVDACSSNTGEQDCLTAEKARLLVADFNDSIKADRKRKPFRNNCSSVNRQPENIQLRLSIKLYSYLLAPLTGKYTTLPKNLTVVAPGPLRELAFTALGYCNDNDKFTYLIQDKYISRILDKNLSQLLLRKIIENNENNEKDVINSVVVYISGDEKFNQPKIEAEKIRASYPTATVYEASKQNFLQRWKEYDVVHISSHAGIVNQEPTILFSDGSDKDNSLTAREIKKLKSGRTKLVVLSACETLVPGMSEKKYSIAESFLFRNTKTSAIATLWKIAGESPTTELIRSFYSYLRKNNGKYASLRKAQLDLIKRDDYYAQPIYWSSFVYIGLPELGSARKL